MPALVSRDPRVHLRAAEEAVAKAEAAFIKGRFTDDYYEYKRLWLARKAAYRSLEYLRAGGRYW